MICTLGDPARPALAARLGTTRSAAALDLWGERLDGAVVAIGNAPTALFRLLEMLDGRRAEAGRDHRHAGRLCRRGGIEGGAARRAALPAIVVRGRKGGSAMAAAAVNALASERRNERATAASTASGSGPAIPNLLTVKAVRVIRRAPVVAYFAKAGRRGNARQIVDRWLRPGLRGTAARPIR